MKKGFTLIEALVYVIIFFLLITVIIAFVFWFIHSSAKAKVVRETLNTSQWVMHVMSQEIRESESVYTPTSNGTQLSLETTRFLPEGEENTFVDFYLCDNRLCMKRESQNPIYLTPENIEVNNLSFSYTETSVYIEIGINYRNPSNRPELDSFIDLRLTTSLR